jgi:hypothetical protein
MKKLFAFLLLTLCISVYSQDIVAVTFSDIKFGTKQMGDAQWNVSACVYTTTCTSSGQNVGSMRAGTGVNFTLGATQYMKFSYTNTDPAEPWTLTVYNANGSVATVLGTYRIINAGQGYFMTSNAPHPNAGNGTLWSTQKGMISGAVSYTEILQPTQSQMDALAASYYSPDPIYTAGATYTPPPPPYSSSITTAQQTRKDAGLVRQAIVSGNSIHIDQVGDNNSITITQNSKNNQVRGIGQQAAQIQGNSNSITVRQGNDTGSNTGKNLLELSVVGDSNTVNLNQSVSSTGTADTGDSNNHYQMLNLAGSTNTVTTVQKDTSASVGHFMETTVSGNTNTIDLQQTNAGAKVMFTNVNGNSNTVSARQKDGGAHYLDLGLVGNGHTINAVQEGSGSHKATISLTNAGAAGTVNLTQTGTTGQVYSIQQSCSTSGCGATIVQGQ